MDGARLIAREMGDLAAFLHGMTLPGSEEFDEQEARLIATQAARIILAPLAETMRLTGIVGARPTDYMVTAELVQYGKLMEMVYGLTSERTVKRATDHLKVLLTLKRDAGIKD